MIKDLKQQEKIVKNLFLILIINTKIAILETHRYRRSNNQPDEKGKQEKGAKQDE